MISVSIQVSGTTLGDKDNDIVVDEVRDAMEQLIVNYIDNGLTNDMAQMFGLPLIDLETKEITVEKA